jgi:hypothetical protein
MQYDNVIWLPRIIACPAISLEWLLKYHGHRNVESELACAARCGKGTVDTGRLS